MATILAQPKRLALLVYLATARPRGFHGRDTLLALFWPESDDERARNSLRQALHHLRRSLGEASIAGRGDREVWVDASLVRCDAAEFDEAIEAGRWEDALTLYRGDFLPGLVVHDSPGVEHWIDDERSRRRRDAIAAAWRLAEASEPVGDARTAEGWARLAVALDPEDDTAELRLATLVDRMRARAAESVMPSAARSSSAPARSATPLASAPSPHPVSPAEGRGLGAEGRPSRLLARVVAIVAAVLGVIAIGWLLYARMGRAAQPAAPTSTVLPFVHMSADLANEYLSVRQSGLRITVQLIDTTTGSPRRGDRAGEARDRARSGVAGGLRRARGMVPELRDDPRFVRLLERVRGMERR